MSRRAQMLRVRAILAQGQTRPPVSVDDTMDRLAARLGKRKGEKA